jgi:ribonuclease-3
LKPKLSDYFWQPELVICGRRSGSPSKAKYPGSLPEAQETQSHSSVASVSPWLSPESSGLFSPGSLAVLAEFADTLTGMALSYPHRQKQLQHLIQKLGLPADTAIQWHLLNLALTHPTVSTAENYEQLEFVGDAVVRLAAAEFLYETYPHLPVGEYAAIRSVLVSDRILASIATSYSLERYLLIADSALKDPLGHESRMAQAFEAVLAALYLSTRTLELVRPWLDDHFNRLVDEILQDPARKNYKAALQEWSQAHYKTLPEYKVREAVARHGAEDRFTAEVWLQGQCLGQGSGRSIKAAEQAAAQVAFIAIRDR